MKVVTKSKFFPVQIGDSRELKWQKKTRIKNPKTNQYNWVIDKT